MDDGEKICDFRILRELRKFHKLSIAELSEKSGVSASVISKLERNQTKAEIDTLFRLARVFRLSLGDLITLAENKIAHLVNEENYRSDGFVFRRIRYGNFCCLYGSADKGTKLSKPDLHGDDFETCWVKKGKVKIELPNEVCIVEEGMSVQFDALMPHTYEVLLDCEIIIVHLKKGNRF
ncbi:MAG: XRE family transcriptional regulator [Lentisphaeria bacterium]|nr:XRE family transcriptional regulator [Lentisphaeria bacterium]